MDGGITKDGLFAVNNTIAPKPSSILSLFSLKGRTAVISGGPAGIGLAVAKTYAEAGANVAIWYNSNTVAHDRAAEIEKEYGVSCKAYKVNVTDAEDVKRGLTQSVQDLNGRLDIFVANAGIPWTQGNMIDGELDHYRKVVTTDIDGVYYCARAAGEIWRRQAKEGTDMNGNKLENYSYGSFIATASMSGHIVNFPQLQSAYNAAKAAVLHLTKCLAVEWIKIARCNSVSPGYTATELTTFVPEETKAIWRSKIPMGREGETHEMRGAYLYLASDAASYTTGADIIVDGGYCLP
ncbi:NAD(P)-binding protein, partial [Aureobasidium melanogenum]